MVHGLVHCEPEDFVHLSGIGREGGSSEFGEPAPEHPWRLAKAMPPDAPYRYDLGVEFLTHFPHHRLDLAFTRLDPAARKTDAQGHAHRRATADQEPAPVRLATGHYDTFHGRLML